jgi:hypothetical protein
MTSSGIVTGARAPMKDATESFKERERTSESKCEEENWKEMWRGRRKRSSNTRDRVIEPNGNGG